MQEGKRTVVIELDGMRDEEIKLTLSNLLPHGHKDMGDMPIMLFHIRLLDGTMIGRCDLRLGDSDMTRVMGHIGYEIDADYRGRHYAEHACRLLCGYARRAHMEWVDITCDVDNAASIRTCERLGATLLGTVEVPPDCPDYALGSRVKYCYRVTL